MTVAADTVLILTHSADHFVIERVTEALRRRGARALRFDTDLFPSEVALATRLGPGGDAQRLRCGRSGDYQVRKSPVSICTKLESR